MAPIDTILVGTDFSAPAMMAFRFACAITRDYGARLVLLHVAEPPGFEAAFTPTAEENRREELSAALNRIEVPAQNVRAERRLETGEAAAEILRVGREIGAGLIVMGTHGRTGLARLLMGSVAEKVVRQATCPVLTVKDPSATAPESSQA